jgi:hypothetical protein
VSELIDNRAHRIRTLKHVITRLHQGEAPAAVKPQVLALVKECTAGEIASMEQELMADGIPATEIMRMCDLHSEALRDVIVDPVARVAPPGHPVDTFKRENKALQDLTARLRAALAMLTLGGGDDAPVKLERLNDVRALFNQLMDVDKHYQRKENLLFPFLERYGITGPSKVMWGKDDEVRGLLKGLGEALGADEATVGEWKIVTSAIAMPALAAVEEMIFKEERILLPMALETLNDSDWGEIWAQSPGIGWCIVDPAEGWRPAATERIESKQGDLTFSTGILALDQLTAIFATLPVDLTFVDAQDRVRFFTEGRDRVFVRPKAIIGRLVQHCHPPGSVHLVDRILSDFREGRQSVAEFWIDFKGRFVHVRYFALRSQEGGYLGTLEVTQDLTRERALEGERRLLQYD